MASIKPMGNKFYVYYYHPLIRDAKGKRKQMYEDFETEEQAERRKDEIERKIKSGELSVPSRMSVTDYFYTKFIPLYAQVKWKFTTWDTNMPYWKEVILPYFGDMKLTKVKPSDIEAFMAKLKLMKVRGRPNTPEEELPYISETTQRYYYVLINCFFGKAVEWEDLEKSPVKCKKPSASTIQRDFWEPEQFEQALQSLQDELLHLAIHFAFRCTLRIGELCGLTWDDIDFDAMTADINKQMQRVKKDALKRQTSWKVFFTFPCQRKDSKSVLILTTPKSDFGNRVNKMSEQLCEELRRRKMKVAMDKIRYGNQYKDYNLVFCLDDGRPLEPGRLSRRFNGWQKNNGLEAMGDFDSIDFHSIRISSTSLKLVVSGGDVKSAQKDLGDKTPHMVLTTYSRSLGKQHASMNERFDEEFYGPVVTSPSESPMVGEDINNELLRQLVMEQLKKPEFLETVLRAMQT